MYGLGVLCSCPIVYFLRRRFLHSADDRSGEAHQLCVIIYGPQELESSNRLVNDIKARLNKKERKKERKKDRKEGMKTYYIYKGSRAQLSLSLIKMHGGGVATVVAEAATNSVVLVLTSVFYLRACMRPRKFVIFARENCFGCKVEKCLRQKVLSVPSTTI